MIVPVIAISNLVLTRQIYSEETNGAHAHHLDCVPLNVFFYHVPAQQLSTIKHVNSTLAKWPVILNLDPGSSG